jgi:hypothetical protein
MPGYRLRYLENQCCTLVRRILFDGYERDKMEGFVGRAIEQALDGLALLM